MQEDPQSASAHSNLGNVHQQQGKPELAVQDYTRAVELAPQVGLAAGRQSRHDGQPKHWRRLLGTALLQCSPNPPPPVAPPLLTLPAGPSALPQPRHRQGNPGC